MIVINCSTNIYTFAQPMRAKRVEYRLIFSLSTEESYVNA